MRKPVVAIDSQDNILVTTAEYHRVQKFTSGGQFISSWEVLDGNGNYADHIGMIYIASTGDIYLSFGFNGKWSINKYSPNGVYISTLGGGGSAPGHFSDPTTMVEDRYGNIYECDYSNNRIQKFSPEGTFLTTWGSYGTAPGQRNFPRGIATTPDDTIIVADSWNNRLQIFTLDGEYLASWGVAGVESGQFTNIGDIKITPDDIVYTTEIGQYWSNDDYDPTKPEHVQKFRYHRSNEKPVISNIIVPTNPNAVGTTIYATGSYTDEGDTGTHTALWQWGDGLSSAGVVSDRVVSGEHTYTVAGVYLVTLTVTDDKGEEDTALAQNFLIVYDPDGGFVTGGGWIDSPAGAFVPDPSLTGKATFGFVSKYHKGANVPTGQTQFKFQAADFAFQSISYDWLVIAGAKAKYKGSGKINGKGDYGFMLTAIDGQVAGGGGVDKVRFKVWDKSTEAIIYDNQKGAVDVSDPTTVIGGGSIVIHKS